MDWTRVRIDEAAALGRAGGRARPCLGDPSTDAHSGAALEAHCFGLREHGMRDWEKVLVSADALSARHAIAYGRQLCRIWAALETPHDDVSSDTDVFGFLEALERDPIVGRPHAEFLREEARQQAMVAAAVVESKKGSGPSSFIKCRRCGSGDVDTDAKQLRSADEPMTVFASCNKCGNRWTMS